MEIREVTEEQHQILHYLNGQKRAIDVELIVLKMHMTQPLVMGTLDFAQQQGWVAIAETRREELIPAQDAQAKLRKGLPEKQFLEVLQTKKRMAMREAAQEAKKRGYKINEIIKWGKTRGWMEKDQAKGELIITDQGLRMALEQLDDDEKALFAVENSNERIFLEDLDQQNIESKRVRTLLKNRPELAKIKMRTIREVTVTKKGQTAIPQLKSKVEEKNVLTSEDITSGNWQNIRLRPYDVTRSVEPTPIAKSHPMQKIIQETRKAFLEMGFNEVASPHAEMGFWCFDMLFQPQDHPARDMQDTFYLKFPAHGELPTAGIVEKVRQTHENGWETGSCGWGYRWSEKEARRMLLRTHTTASTIRALAQNPHPPRKVFCVGRVFRNETISFKHLPEFHQVDGIIIDESSSFCALLGTVQEFYRKMGYPKVKFKPAFFPYTEPSAEVFVWMDAKQCWIELGGCGVFRPEVTMPTGCTVPVLAWGLGLERLAMLRYGIDDIRILYGSDLDWLQEVPLCR